MLIRDVNLSNLVRYIKASDDINQARLAFLQDKVHAELVVNDKDNQLLGIITSTDILKINPADYQGLSAGDICQKDVVSVTPDTSIKHASALMLEHQCHHLIVTDKGQVTGVLSSIDIVDFYYQAYHQQ